VRAVASGLYLESMRLVPLQPHVLTFGSSAPLVWRWRCVSCTSAIYLVVCTLGHGREASEGCGLQAVSTIHAPSAPTTPCAHLWVKRTSCLAVEVCFMYLSNIPCSVYPEAWRGGR
jgi:hypothetical protein